MSEPQIFGGDCIAVMAGMAPASVDSIVTDPPYHFASIVKRFGAEGAAPARSDGATGVYERSSRGFMGKSWDGGDIAFRPETWTAALRVLKPGGHLVAFGAPKNYHRLTCAIEDAGFEIRDSLMWVFGSGFPKSHNLHDEWEGWGTALKPAYEPIILARKPLIGTVAENVLAHGTGALNIDACRVEGAFTSGWSKSGSKASENVAMSGRNYERPPKPDAEGRWPANLVHDGSEEVLAAFPETKSGTLTPDMNVKASTGWSGGSQPGRVKSTFEANSGSAARFFATFKWDNEECPGAKNDPSARSAANQFASCETPTADALAGTETLGSKSAASPVTPASTGNSNASTHPLSLAPDADQTGSTDTTPITPSPSKSFGSASHVTGKSTNSGSAARVAVDSDPVVGTRFLYHPKAGKNDRAGSKHPTVKPIALMRWLVRLITPPGGVVLDPFAGSGTTGQAAMEDGFDVVLIEREAEYLADIRRRIANVTPPKPKQESMFGDAA